MAEWGRTDESYSARVGHLQGVAGGLNGGAILDDATLIEDAVIDTLYGDAGLDLFFTGFAATRDKIRDLSAGELQVGV